MKKLKQKIVGFAFILGALMFLPANANANIDTTSDSIELVSKDDLIGGWEYTVEGAPDGYDKGFMMIVKQGGVYKVQVQIGASGAVIGKNVVVKGNKISFTIAVEGDVVTVALEAKGSKITGTSTSAVNGVMNIMAVKSISPE